MIQLPWKSVGKSSPIPDNSLSTGIVNSVCHHPLLQTCSSKRHTTCDLTEEVTASESSLTHVFHTLKLFHVQQTALWYRIFTSVFRWQFLLNPLKETKPHIFYRKRGRSRLRDSPPSSPSRSLPAIIDFLQWAKADGGKFFSSQLARAQIFETMAVCLKGRFSPASSAVFFYK